MLGLDQSKERFITNSCGELNFVPWADTPCLCRHPPGQTPLGRPPWADPPGRLPGRHIPPPEHCGIRSTSGRYASYWYAFLFLLCFPGVYLVGNIGRHHVSFRTCLLGAYLTLPVFMLTLDLSDLLYVLRFCAVSAATSALGKYHAEGKFTK